MSCMIGHPITRRVPIAILRSWHSWSTSSETLELSSRTTMPWDLRLGWNILHREHSRCPGRPVSISSSCLNITGDTGASRPPVGWLVCDMKLRSLPRSHRAMALPRKGEGLLLWQTSWRCNCPKKNIKKNPCLSNTSEYLEWQQVKKRSKEERRKIC